MPALLVAASCGDGADEPHPDSATIDSPDASGPQLATAPLDLSGELIVADDLGDGWGPGSGAHPGGLLDADFPTAQLCPNGDLVELPAGQADQLLDGAASVELLAQNSYATVTEALHHDPEGVLGAGFEAMLESCTGQSWRQDGDPPVNLELARVDDVSGLHAYEITNTADDGQLYGTDLVAVATVDGVFVSVIASSPDPPGSDSATAAQDAFPAAIGAAIAKVGDGSWQAGLFGEPPLADTAAEITEAGPRLLVVTGNDGCKLLDSVVYAIAVGDIESIDPDLGEHVQWFITQVLQTVPGATVSVMATEMEIHLPATVTATTAAEQLRERIGKRLICL